MTAKAITTTTDIATLLEFAKKSVERMHTCKHDGVLLRSEYPGHPVCFNCGRLLDEGDLS